MDAQVVEEDVYSDDDLDALHVNALHELQEDAFRSTGKPQEKAHLPSQKQQRSAPAPAPPPSPAATTGGFGRLSVGPSPDVAAFHRGLQEPSSDYGEFDDEMLDGEIFDGAEQSTVYERARSVAPGGDSTQNERWREQRYGAPPQRSVNQAQQSIPRHLDGKLPSENNVVSRDNMMLPTKVHPDINQATTSLVDGDSLQAQVQRLLREREALQRAVRNANDTSFAKTGEIAIVRANMSKAEQEFESRIKAQEKLYADEAARYKIEVERARAETQKVTTEKSFLENDLAEGTKQLRQVQRTARRAGDKASELRDPGRGNILATPKKSKNLSYGDGFDDDEVQILSPSKLALRGKSGTPKAGAKRKRRVVDGSPAQPQPLELAEPARIDPFEETLETELPIKPIASAQSQRGWDANFQFTQKLLNHRIEPGQERTIEALSKFSLPSQSGKALSTVLYDKILMLRGGPGAEDLPAAVGLIVVALWSQCLREHYHNPVHLLINLIEFILLLEPLKTAPELINSLMELAQETADIIIIPRCQKKPQRQDSAQITAVACLRVIQMMAQDCSIDTEEITRFWRTVRFDFIMMLLSFIHPLEEIHIAVALLRTGILENSFAMIIPPGDGKQDATEARVIDNLSRLLVESPRPAQGEPSLDAAQLSELRLDILALMDAMCECSHGAEALAKHRLVIGRLVRVMNDELDRAYDYSYGHEKRIALVNASTHLLYFLTSNHMSLIDMQARLSVIPGGEKKFLIALTRLAFSEGGLLEGGIEDEVVDEAHQMLEMRVSPEEAEQLVGAFASAQSARRGSKEPG